jgi:phage regulator Rha-like protein
MTLVEKKGNELMASTLTIAKGVNLEHRAVMSLVRKYKEELNDFRLMTFEMSKETGGRPVEISWLDEEQATFLITLMKNSMIVVKFKKNLTKEFYRMKSALAEISMNHKNAEWLEKRKAGKLTHRVKTDIIKLFIDYAENQGSKSPKKYYINIAKMENAALFLLQEKYPNVRDVLNGHQLSVIQTADQIVAKAINEGMYNELFYKDIYKLAKKRVLAMAELVGKSIVPMFNQEQIEQ